MRVPVEGRPELLVFEIAGLAQFGERELAAEEIICVLDEATELGVERVMFEVTAPTRPDDLLLLSSSASKRVPQVTVAFRRGCFPDARSASELGDAGVADVALPLDSFRDDDTGSLSAIDAMRDEGLGVRAVIAGWPGLTKISLMALRLASCGATRLQIDVLCGSTRCSATSAMLERLAREIVGVARAGVLAMIVSELPLVRRIEVETSRASSAGARMIPGAPIELNDSRTTMRVVPTGDVTPSRALPMIAGNVRRQRLDGIWSVSSLYPGLRDRARLLGRCGDCAWREQCGGSRARAWHAAGNYFAADPACGLPLVIEAGTAEAATA